MGCVAVVFNLYLITWINPAYWGYGKPEFFNYIQVSDDHVFLYDIQYSFHEDDNTPSRHEENVPNMRLHLVDRNTHEHLFSQLVGDYMYPEDYGSYPLLVERNTYYHSTPDYEIQSLSYFDVTAEECVIIAKDGMKIVVEGDEVEIFDIFQDIGSFKIKTDKGDVAVLSKSEPLFYWLVESASMNKSARFSLTPDVNSPDKKILSANGEKKEINFLKGEIVNRLIKDETTYAMIYSLNTLKETNPKLSLVNGDGILRWEKSLEDLKGITSDDELEYIHRSILVEDCCYITSGPYLFEFDLESGQLNWWIKI